MKKILFLILLTAIAYPQEWYNTAYKKRFKITINSSAVPAALDSFPVYFPYSAAPAGFSSDGSDLVVTASDGVTVLKREVVGSPASHLFFRSDIAADADSIFYMYFSNSAASNTNDADTWNDLFTAVWHFEDNPADSVAQDATINNNDGTGHKAMTADNLVAGQIGKAWRVDGVNDYIETNVNWVSGDYTYYGVFKPAVTGELAGALFGLHNPGANDRLYFGYNTSGWFTVGVGASSWTGLTTIASDQNPHLYAMTYNGSGADIYADTLVTSKSGAVAPSGELYLLQINFSGAPTANYIAGDLSEWRIFNGIVSESQMETIYNNFFGVGFFTVGSVESIDRQNGFGGYSGWGKY